MNNSLEYFPDPFNVETFRGHIVDIVHKQSVERVAAGNKPSDISDRNQAKIVLKRIDELKRAGVVLRFIEEINQFETPDTFNIAEDSLILGGAFSGQCLKAYQETLDKHGIKYTTNPLITVRA